MKISLERRETLEEVIEDLEEMIEDNINDQEFFDALTDHAVLTAIADSIIWQRGAEKAKRRNNEI